MITEDQKDKLGELVDSLDNIAHAMNFPLPIEMHLEQLKKLLPEKVKSLRELYIEIAGENPWE